MKIMALDTSLQRCSVAILVDHEPVSVKSADMERGHAEALAPMAASCLRASGLRVSDLDRISVVVGPGGFTGIRVALSFARGLAIGTGVDVVGVSSLQALAASAREQIDADALIAPVIDARRGQVYAALYGPGDQSVAGDFIADPKRVMKILGHSPENPDHDAHFTLVGSGVDLVCAHMGNHKILRGFEQIDPIIVARLGASRPKPTGRPAPVYLRAPDAKPPRPGPLVRS